MGPVERLVTDEIDDEAPPAPGAQLPADRDARGRVLVETGIGERLDEKTRAMRAYEGPWIVPALETAGFLPETVDVVAMSHLHFDHAGGLLRADGERAFPHATIVAQKAEWEVALGDNPRLVASYVQPELTLVKDWGAQGWADGERELLPGVTVVPTGGHSAGHQAVIVVAATGPARDAGVLRRPVHAAVGREPALGDRVRRLPARLGRPQGRAVRPGRGRGLDDRAVARGEASDRAPGARPGPVPVRAGVGRSPRTGVGLAAGGRIDSMSAAAPPRRPGRSATRGSRRSVSMKNCVGSA